MYPRFAVWVLEPCLLYCFGNTSLKHQQTYIHTHHLLYNTISQKHGGRWSSLTNLQKGTKFFTFFRESAPVLFKVRSKISAILQSFPLFCFFFLSSVFCHAKTCQLTRKCKMIHVSDWLKICGLRHFWGAYTCLLNG